METDLINKILRENPLTRRNYQGCFPSDKIPTLPQYPSSLVVNLDPHKLEGTHWVALFAYGHDLGVSYFDSLDIPIERRIRKFLSTFKTIYKNSNPIQSPLSSNCAHHCICFIYFLSLGFTLENYLDFLTSQYDPDLFVKDFSNMLINKI